MNNEAAQKLPSGGAEREARERKEIARKVVAQYNAGFIDQQNNTPRPGLVKMIADALEKCANEARLEEARWWSENYHHQEACDLPPAECLTCSHIADLERAVGGQHEN